VSDSALTETLRASRPRRVELALGLPLIPRGPAYTCIHLAQSMAGPGLSVGFHAPIILNGASHLHATTGWAAPRFLAQFGWRFARQGVMAAMERHILAALDRSGDDLVWTFGEVPLGLTRALAKRGARVVREKFNCAKALAYEILSAEHARHGLVPFTGITCACIAKEAEELAMADAIFCPSPMVRASLRAIGIADDRLLDTSYGWEPERFAGDARLLPPVAGPTLLFAGTMQVRKGIHILLEAWAKANIGGRLLLAGSLDPIVEKRWGHLLARPDIIRLGHIGDMGSAFRSADWFVFPSLEEGGPQVTYEAAGCGVPALVSPMGAGAFTRNGIEGVVLNSREPNDWARLFASLADRKAERDRMAEAALQRAQMFTWASVGGQRRHQLLGLAERC